MAVSYTHLDVYKRQIGYRAHEASSVGIVADEPAIFIDHRVDSSDDGRGGRKLVRQLRHPVLVGHGQVKAPDSAGLQALDSRFKLGLFYVKAEIYIIPVSYTHLDVYKRQYNGRVRFNDPAYYFKKQIFATALGILGMYVVSKMDYHIILRYAPAVYLIALGLSTAVLFFGQEYNGSRRWLSLGPLSFQPSEFAKVAVVLLLAWVKMCIRDRWSALLPTAAEL